jgi:hypothetical protein
MSSRASPEAPLIGSEPTSSRENSEEPSEVEESDDAPTTNLPQWPGFKPNKYKTFLSRFYDAYEAKVNKWNKLSKGPRQTAGVKGNKRNWVLAKVWIPFKMKFPEALNYSHGDVKEVNELVFKSDETDIMID